MKNFVKGLVLSAVCLTFTSCATIFTGTTDNILFNSDPPGATILIEGIDKGETPATLSVKRPGLGDTHVTLRLDGYEDRVFVLESEFNVVSVLNFAGLLGWGVDIVTGAVTKYNPRNYDMELRANSSALNLEDLRIDPTGSFVIPAGLDRVIVKDATSGLALVFE